VVSEETGTLSLARQGRLERPITSSRLQELLGVATAQVAKPGGKPANRPEQKAVSATTAGRSVGADSADPRA
jgi:hypothetical protein